MAIPMKELFDCNVAWDSMEGDDSRRFCAQCQKTVFNLTGLTEAEAEAEVEVKEESTESPLAGSR